MIIKAPWREELCPSQCPLGQTCLAQNTLNRPCLQRTSTSVLTKAGLLGRHRLALGSVKMKSLVSKAAQWTPDWSRSKPETKGWAGSSTAGFPRDLPGLYLLTCLSLLSRFLTCFKPKLGHQFLSPPTIQIYIWPCGVLLSWVWTCKGSWMQVGQELQKGDH